MNNITSSSTFPLAPIENIQSSNQQNTSLPPLPLSLQKIISSTLSGPNTPNSLISSPSHTPFSKKHSFCRAQKKKKKTTTERKISLGASLINRQERTTLLNDLAGLLNHPDNYNIILNVNNYQFFAHRELLAYRSPYFKKIFMDELGEIDQIEIKPITTSEVFTEVLLFIYTGQIKLTCDNVCHVYREASHFQLNGLENLCANFFLKNLNSATILSLLNASFHSCAQKLYKEALFFYLSHQFDIRMNISHLPQEILHDISSINKYLSGSQISGLQIKNEYQWLLSKCKTHTCNIKHIGDDEVLIFWKINPDLTKSTKFFSDNFQLGGSTWKLTLESTIFQSTSFSNQLNGKKLADLKLELYSTTTGPSNCIVIGQIESVCDHEEMIASVVHDHHAITSLKRHFDEQHSASVQIFFNPTTIFDSIVFQISIKILPEFAPNDPSNIYSCSEEIIEILREFSLSTHPPQESVMFIVDSKTYSIPSWFLEQREYEFFTKIENQTSVHHLEIQQEIFELFLSYIYTGELPFNTFDECRMLYLFTKENSMLKLQQSCVENCSKYITVHNALSLMNTSIPEKEDGLYHEIFSFVENNAKNLFHPSHWDFFQLSRDNFLMLLKSSNLNIPELDLIKATAAWIEKQPCPLELLKETKQSIRYSLLDLKTVWREVRKVKVLGIDFYSPEELDEISRVLGKNQSIHAARAVKYPWVLSETEDLFIHNTNMTHDRQLVMYWKIPFSGFIDIEWIEETSLHLNSKEYSLTLSQTTENMLYLAIQSSDGFDFCKVEAYLMNEDAGKIESLTLEDSENTMMAFFKNPQLGSGFIYNGFLHIQINIEE